MNWDDTGFSDCRISRPDFESGTLCPVMNLHLSLRIILFVNGLFDFSLKTIIWTISSIPSDCLDWDRQLSYGD